MTHRAPISTKTTEKLVNKKILALLWQIQEFVEIFVLSARNICLNMKPESDISLETVFNPPASPGYIFVNEAP